jgi:16S rRNA (cytosine967-C5)-methyltransferase
MRLYPNLVRALAQALHQVFATRQSALSDSNLPIAERVLDELFKKNPKWGSRDRKWVAESFYTKVRFFRYFQQILLKTTDLNAWQAADAHFWDDLAGLEMDYLEERAAEPLRAVRESLPDDLDAYMQTALGAERWDKILPALNQPAPVVLRVNSLKTNMQKVLEFFKKNEISATQLDNYALRLEGRYAFQQWDIFKKGWLETQDFASQQIVNLLSIQPGETIIDTCAGAGGKSLQIGARLANTGKLISMDILDNKLEQAKARGQKAGIRNQNLVNVAHSKQLQPYLYSADRILIDAPCTGTGTWRRQADAKYRLSQADIQKTVQLQAQILQTYTPLLKKAPHTQLVYATCSILPEENQQQIQNFLKTPVGAAFKLVSEQTLYPDTFGYDGFYMANLIPS